MKWWRAGKRPSRGKISPSSAAFNRNCFASPFIIPRRHHSRTDLAICYAAPSASHLPSPGLSFISLVGLQFRMPPAFSPRVGMQPSRCHAGWEYVESLSTKLPAQEGTVKLSGLSPGAGSRSSLVPGLTGVADRAADVEMRAKTLSPTTRNSQSETSLPNKPSAVVQQRDAPRFPPATGHRRERALIRPSKVPSATEEKTGKAARRSHFASRGPQPSCEERTPTTRLSIPEDSSSCPLPCPLPWR